ncbi:type III pantothenate kinase [bacterium SCSIO 12741]|nr:type III pantothenate kinase [bacterium SCSIO 12741]
MNLVLDLGNTRSKIALFDRSTLVASDSMGARPSSEELQKWLQNHPQANQAIISSVVDHSVELEDWIRTRMELIVLDSSTPLPIKNDYATPDTLGKDRLSAAVGAQSLFPGKAVLSIDFGTCIKYDFVSPEGTYLGGAISPGLNMRFRSLHTFTDKLPLLQLDGNPELIGRDTNSSILSGVAQGIIFEIEGAMRAYSSQWSNLNTIFTGGDHQYFAKAFKNSIFARPELTLIGLNRILEYNEDR